MDFLLHGERTGARRQTTLARDMPDGAMVARGDAAYLVKGGRIYRWRFQGYGASSDNGTPLDLLTPPAMVKILAAGYTPGIHPSCE